MNSTIETADYLGKHKEMVRKFTNEVNNKIISRLGRNNKTDNFIKEANTRAFTHDDDKLQRYRTLELYAHRDELKCEDEKKEYKASHKLTQRHHVQYFVERDSQMNIHDIYEMMADIYSSTLLRGKKAYDELLEEQEDGGFSDEYLSIILNTYGSINYNFKTDISKKYPKMQKSYDFVDLLRDHLLKGKELKPFINKKED